MNYVFLERILLVLYIFFSFYIYIYIYFFFGGGGVQLDSLWAIRTTLILMHIK